MGIHDRNTVPRRPREVAEPGSLIVSRYNTRDGEVPELVVDSYPVFGNKFHDNTAPYWYWVYLIMPKGGGQPYKDYVEKWRIFQQHSTNLKFT